MDMVIAAGGGERDEAVDAAILTASETRTDREILLNEKLTTELRPTLFLAQLSNLLAGNISIVHKVTGSSRTFMGEEGAGVSAIDTAFARIRSGQATHMLVGGAFQSEHPDMLLGYELGGYLHRGPHASVWQRGKLPGGGIISGSGSAFLVLESREHAEKRGRKPYAELVAVTSGRSKRGNGFDAAVDAMVEKSIDGAKLVISGASGGHAATAAEKAALDRHGAVARGYSTLTGHMKEAQFFFAVRVGSTVGRRTARPLPLRCVGKTIRRQGVARSGDNRRLPLFRGHGAGRRRGVKPMAKYTDHLGRPVVAVTGIGVVTSLGVGKHDNWAALTVWQIRHSSNHPLSGRSPQHPHFRHRRLPVVEQSGRERADL